uniref:Uncharacterized protein n=1 Tax=Rhizophora mucronata TaxID=61149 RepID=A0A2P2NK35_RHIMU
MLNYIVSYTLSVANYESRTWFSMMKGINELMRMISMTCRGLQID